MLDKETVIAALRDIRHPELKDDIINLGIVSRIEAGQDSIGITLRFPRQRDPFANSIKRQIVSAIGKLASVKVSIDVEEAETKEQTQAPSTTAGIKHVIAVFSGKGGVGKSTVATNIAVTLSQMDYRVGVLDADIYGPSQPKMFALEDYQPLAVKRDDAEYIVPAEKWNIKVMSIGYFIKSDDALLWRGPMAHSALRQLIHQTLWEDLDFLIIDMPPGTGDVHLSIINELRIDCAVAVTTPQDVAVADAVRGIRMFQTPNVDIPVLGVVENMSWFSPEELPMKRYYIFGRGGGARCAEITGCELLCQIPVVESLAEGSDTGMPAVLFNQTIERTYAELCGKIVEKTVSKCE